MAETPPTATPPTPVARAAAPRRRAWAWLLAGSVAALVGVAGVTGGWLVRSERGSAWLLQQVPGLEVQGLGGALFSDTLRAQRLRYTLGAGVLELQDVRLDGLQREWHLWPAAGEPWLRLRLAGLQAGQARWTSAPAPATPEPASAPPTDLRLPFALTVDQARIGRLQVDGGLPLEDIAARVALNAAQPAGGPVHRLDSVTLRSARWRADGSLQIGADAPMPVQARVQLHSAEGAATAWQAEASAEGPLARLQARAHLAGAAESATAASAADRGAPPTPPPSLDAQATVLPFAPWPLGDLTLRTEHLDLAALHPGAPRTRLQANAEIRTRAADVPADIDARIDNSAPGRWDEGALPLRALRLRAQARPDQLASVRLEAFALDLGADATGGRLSGQGTLQATGPQAGGRLDLTLDGWRPATLDARLPAMRLSGPLALTLDGWPAPAAAAAPAGAASSASSAAPAPGADRPVPWRAALRAELQGRLDGAPPGPADVTLALRGRADAAELQLEQALARVGGASARLTGRLAWPGADDGARWRWQAEGELQDFDPTQWWRDAPAAARRGAHRLNATLASEGAWRAAPAGPAASALDRLEGRLDVVLAPSQWAGLPLDGSLQAERAAGAAPRVQARLAVAGQRLDARLQQAASDLSLEATVEAPDMARLAPWLASLPAGDALAWAPRSGTVQARVQGQWPADKPRQAQWQVQAQAGRLSHPQWQVGRLQAQASGRGWGEDALSLGLTGEALAWQQARVNTVRADLTGSLREHQLSLQADSPVRPPAWFEQLLGARTGSGSRLTLSATGRWQPAADGGTPLQAGRWSGRLTELQGRASDGSGQPWLAGRHLGLAAAWGDGFDWQALSAEPGRLELPGTALRWDEARWQAGTRDDLALQARIEPFQLAPLLARAQPELGWRGDLELAGELQVRAGERFDADVVFERRGGDLSVADDVRDPATVHRALGLSDLRLGMAAHDGTWHFTAAVAGRQLGEMAGVASVRTDPAARWPRPADPLDGVFQLHVSRLAAWGGWVPPGWRLGGDLQSAAFLGGRWGAPEVSGRLAARGLEVRNGLEGVHLSDGTVDIAFAGESARIERFDWRGGDGWLRVAGDASLGDEARADLTLRAERLRVLGRLDRRVVASGQVQVALRPRSADINGALKIDEGLFDLTRGGAPALDDDVRVVGAGASGPQPGDPGAAATARAQQAAAGNGNGNGNGASTRFENRLSVALDLGPALRVKGRGLDTFLRGTLQITNPGRQLAAHGDIRTERGTYAAYGQKLEISRGLLDFNGPLEDPRLDILAVRPNLDVQVGVAVTGSALNPRVKLYSEPEMSDTDKLSWLVLGRAPEGLGRADTALLQRAAFALLAGEGEAPTDAFLSSIGLSDFGVRQAGEGSEQTTVVSLGKQLSRRWYVGYERSINAQAGTWQLIYRIAQRFTLRAQSGEDSALDLIWSWRWD